MIPLLGTLFGGAASGLSKTDNTSVNPAQTNNQSGGSNTMQIEAAKTIWPFSPQSGINSTMIIGLVVFGVFCLLVWKILKK